MSIINAHTKILDEKMCFLLWAELGSLPKVHAHLIHHGSINPNTGKPFTNMSIHQAARRYILENMEDARKVFLEHEDTRTQEEWEEFLVQVASKMYGVQSSRQRLYRWLRMNNFKEKYEYIWSRYVYLDDIEDAEQSKKG